MVSIARRNLLLTLALAGWGTVSITPAAAQGGTQPRVFVASYGDDDNACASPATACRTFPAALAKVVPGGVITCADSTSFGLLIITKAVSVLCDNAPAGIMPATVTDTIVVNAGDNDVVYLSGFDLDGRKTGLPGAYGVNGIRYINGAALHVSNTSIRGFRSQAISIEPAASKSVTLYLQDVQIMSSGVGTTTTSGAIRAGVGNNGITNVVMDRTRVGTSANTGLRADTTGLSSGRIRIVIRNSEFVGDGIAVMLKAPVGTVEALVSDSVLTQNNSTGLFANGAGAKATVIRTSILFNTTGIGAQNGGQLIDAGGNVVTGNYVDGVFTSTTTPTGPIRTP